MKLSSFTTILIFLVLITTGIAFLPLLSIQLDSSSSLPSVNVSYSWQGATGRVIEQEVTSALEGLFSRMRGVKNVSSTSSSGSGYITVEFDKTTKFDAARFEIATLIRQAYPHFPEQVSYPSISVNRPDNQRVKPLLTYTLNASVPPYLIQKYAEDQIKSRLLAIKGIHEINVYGAMPMEWVMEYNMEKIRILNITTNDIQAAISQYLATETAGLGYEFRPGKDTTVTVIHLVLQNNPSKELNFLTIPVKKAGGRMVYVNDVVVLRHQEQTPTSCFRINGANTINMVISANELANQLVVAKLVMDKLKEIEKTLPQGYFLLKSYDATEFINLELTRNAKRTLFTLVILLLFVLLVSRQFRYLLLIVISLIANLSIAVIFYNLFHIEMHLYSLAGITVSLGLMLNNSIVMIDHLKHHKNLKVFLATLASTLAAIAALFVVFLVEGKLRENLLDFSIVIIINLSVSLFVALFLIPALMEKLPLRTRKNKRWQPWIMSRKRHNFLQGTVVFSKYYGRFILFTCRFRWAFILLFIVGFGVPIFLLPAKIEKETPFARLYNKTLASPWYTENAKPILDVALGGTLRLFIQNVFENSYYGHPEKTTLYVNAQLPYGSTLDQMNQLIMLEENFLKQFKEIEQFQTQVYSAQYAQITIYFKKEYEDTGFPFQLKELVTQNAIGLGGADWNIYGVGDRGFSNSVSEFLGNYRVTINGYNYDELYQLSEWVKKKLMENPRVKEVSILSRPQWARDRSFEFVMDFDRVKLIGQNVSPLALYSKLTGYSKSDNIIGSTVAGGEWERIRLVSKQSQAMDLWQIQQSPEKVGAATVRLKNLSDIKKEAVSLDICKENQQYRLILAYDYIGSGRFGQRHQERVIKEVTPLLPLGYSAKGENNNWWYNEAKKQYWLLLFVIGIIFFICAILLESLLQPLAVIFMIPLSYIGVFLTFYLFGLNFDQGGFAAFILLSGITVNSALYIINDFTILKRNKGARTVNSLSLYLKAYNHKIIPILLIKLSTILGLVPFFAGGQKEVFWPALAAGTVGGLIFSIIGIVVFLPMVLLKKSAIARNLPS